MYPNIINHISYDLQCKKYTSKDNILYIREKNESIVPITPMIIVLYNNNNNHIEITDEYDRLLGNIYFNNYTNDWNEFKRTYCIQDDIECLEYRMAKL